MWRAAKRAAAAALRDAGRGVAASSARPSAPSSSAAAERVAEAAARRHQQRRRSTNAEGLVQLRHIWELETAAAARRRARGDDAAATAMGMIRALRRAGCSWFDVAANPAVRREASNAVAAWESGGGVAAAAATAATAVRRPVEVAARRAAARLRRVVPTLALRHAGGSWADVLYHPAFRFRLEIARAAESDAKAMIAAAPRAPLDATRGLTRGARGRGGGGSGSSGDAIGPRYPDAREEVATFISSAAALRHAGCSWFDVARHAAFHACVRARVVAGGYSVYLATFVRHPFTTALVTSVTKCVASDVAVQKFVEGREEIDRRRVFCFFVLGLTYVGAFQYGLYNNVMKPMGDVLTRAYGTGTSVGVMVAIDQFLVCPLIYLPAFFGLKMWANGECTLAALPGKVGEKMGFGFGAETRDGEGEERRNDPAAGWLTLVALWVYWMPAQAINFWAVPRHLTIPFMNLMGFGWNGIMSAMNGASDAEEKPRVSAEARSAARHAAVAAAVPAERAAARAAESATAAAAEDCLADERCVRALSAASSDALAVAAVATAGENLR